MNQTDNETLGEVFLQTNQWFLTVYFVVIGCGSTLNVIHSCALLFHSKKNGKHKNTIFLFCKANFLSDN